MEEDSDLDEDLTRLAAAATRTATGPAVVSADRAPSWCVSARISRIFPTRVRV